MVHQRQQCLALMQAQASASATLGDLQVTLVRELAARLRAAGVPATQTLRIEATADRMEAAAREMRRALERLPADTTACAACRSNPCPGLSDEVLAAVGRLRGLA